MDEQELRREQQLYQDWCAERLAYEELYHHIYQEWCAKIEAQHQKDSENGND